MSCLQGICIDPSDATTLVLSREQIFDEVVRMMANHNWLLNAIEREWITTSEKDIRDYLSKVIGGECKNGGTFSIPLDDESFIVIGFFQTNRSGIEISEIDSRKKHFFKWTRVSKEVKNNHFSDNIVDFEGQLTLEMFL